MKMALAHILRKTRTRMTPIPCECREKNFLPWQDVRPSVRLSHASILSKRLNISSKFFSPSGSQTILFFLYQTRWQYSDRNPSATGASNARGMKNHDFRPIARFISEVMQHRAIVTMEGEYETAPKLSNGISFNDPQ